ncbi:MAG: isoprenylcysteine carboxylmethyltransferase family protein [Cyanobacteria bacterium NC_groundwater_1444_Ag_S-0.65um_54_12]|nr:isoprenylcysteine carboxylmethyltransferase family protein [Cyanobacteria bacterium NC_groundwater_1444_Ag_S-0.65um_54_12]
MIQLRFSSPLLVRRLAETKRLLLHGGNLLAALLWLPLVYSAWSAWVEQRAPLSLPLLAVNTLIVCLFLLRRASRETSKHSAAWFLGISGTTLPLFMRAEPLTLIDSLGPAAGTTIAVASLTLQGISLLGILSCLLALGRSFGIVAAHRGLATSGPYQVVRHPLYSCELAFYSAFLLGNPSWQNFCLLVACFSLQTLRANYEERLLLRDPRYRNYRRKVPYRFIPQLL